MTINSRAFIRLVMLPNRPLFSPFNLSPLKIPMLLLAAPILCLCKSVSKTPSSIQLEGCKQPGLLRSPKPILREEEEDGAPNPPNHDLLLHSKNQATNPSQRKEIKRWQQTFLKNNEEPGLFQFIALLQIVWFFWTNTRICVSHIFVICWPWTTMEVGFEVIHSTVSIHLEFFYYISTRRSPFGPLSYFGVGRLYIFPILQLINFPSYLSQNISYLLQLQSKPSRRNCTFYRFG